MTDALSYTAVCHQDLVILAWFMADNGYNPQQIAYAIEKPWKHDDLLDEAKSAQAARDAVEPEDEQ